LFQQLQSNCQPISFLCGYRFLGVVTLIKLPTINLPRQQVSICVPTNTDTTRHTSNKSVQQRNYLPRKQILYAPLPVCFTKIS